MPDRYADKLTSLSQAVLESPGRLEPEFRKAVFLAGQAGADLEAELPSAWRTLVEKIATAAYKVTDGDIDTLRQDGLDDDAIFEVVLATALGAASARLERGLAVVNAGLKA
ncbi:MAG: hypothetical protein ACE5GE_09250 [Phycisphaerae bacterium]